MVAPGRVGEVDLGARQELLDEDSPHLQASSAGEGLEGGHPFLQAVNCFLAGALATFNLWGTSSFTSTAKAVLGHEILVLCNDAAPQ